MRQIYGNETKDAFQFLFCHQKETAYIAGRFMATTEVLYLSYDGMTDSLGQSQVIPYLAGLSKSGFHFHIISFEKEKNFVRESAFIGSLLKSHHIEWNPLTYTKNPPVVSTLLDLQRMKKKGKELIIKHQIQLVHARSYISGMAALYLKKKTGVKFLFDMRGFWADERVDGGLWNLKNPLYNSIYLFFKKQEKKMITAADAIISLTENAKHEIDSWNLRSTSQIPVNVIPCCVDMNLFDPSGITVKDRDEMRRKLNISTQAPVVSYLGALGTWYLLDEMMQFFKLFLSENPAAVFLFITPEDPEIITSSAVSHQIDNSSIRIIAARRNEVPLLLSLSDFSLFFIKPAYSKKASSPTKQGEIMAMGIPLVCNKGIGDTDMVVRKYRSGISIDLNATEMQKAVHAYPELKKIRVEDLLHGAKEFYSLESGTEKYRRVYRSVLQ